MLNCVHAHNFGDRKFYTVDLPYRYDPDFVDGVKEALRLYHPGEEGHSFLVDPWEESSHCYIVVFSNSPDEVFELTKELRAEYDAGRLMPWRHEPEEV